MEVTWLTGERVVVRDRPWRITKAIKGTDSHHLVELEALDGCVPYRLTISCPPEEPTPLPPEELTFALSELESFQAWSTAHLLLGSVLVRETGVLTGARFGRVALEAYQLAPTLRLLAKPKPSLLIADDVGLGKTIEAGLAILELKARGRASRVLIVTPPGLMDQWQEELENKLGLRFEIIDNAAGLARVQTGLPAGVSPWDAIQHVITSVDYIKKETVCTRALRKRWDLIVVDEAHALAESGTPEDPYRTQRTRLGEGLREATRGLLLLTATPHNGHAHAFRSLLELVDPTLASLHGRKEDVERRIETARIRRMKSQIRRRLPDGSEEPCFPIRTVRGIPIRNLDDAERGLLRKVASYCSRTARQAEGTEQAELIGFAMQIVKKRALSSRLALERTIAHRLDALRNEDAREAPPQRAELRDMQADIPLQEGVAERTAQRILKSAIPSDERRRKAEVSALSTIRKALARLREHDPKVEALLTEIREVLKEDPAEKVIVFTEYLDTLEAIGNRVDQEPDLAGHYVILRGGLTRRQRLQRQEEFEQRDTRLLLATDAASEGLNLQRYCRRVIHFELPWNPNRMEQRNGRVDRYGQTREPIIRYLFYPDSPEEDVLSRLVERIENMAAERISTPDIFGLLAGERAINQALVSLDPEAADVEDSKKALVHLFEDRTAEFVRNVQPLLAAGDDAAAEQKRVLELLDTAEPLLPDDTRLEESVLRALGTYVAPVGQAEEGIFRIDVPPAYRGDDVRPGYHAATFRRSVAVRYRADQIEYLTPVHPLIQSIAADARRRFLQVYPSIRGLPPRRLAYRLVPTSEPPTILFTFLGSIRGGAGLLEEHILVVRVDTTGRVVGDARSNEAYLTDPAPAGQASPAVLKTLFSNVFAMMRGRARQEAEHLLLARATELRRRRSEQAKILERDLDVDVADRMRDIDDEARRARGLIEDSGQLKMFGSDETRPTSIQTRRRAVEAQAGRRREEIAAFATVEEIAPPRPMGAVFLIPEGVEQ